MKNSVFLTCMFFLLNWGTSHAQFQTHLSRSELGLILGGSYYIGDLNQFRHFKGTQPAISLIYRYNVNTRLSFRGNFSYGNVVGDDQWATESLLKNRNLNFKSDIFELAAGLEFHYMKFVLGSDRYHGTAYLFAQLALFKMNPKTSYNGEWVYLQPLGTEGQGSDLNSKHPYSLIQLAIPIGVGVKFGLGKKATIGIDYGIRKTFTDYLDDIGSGTYVDPVELAAANGPLSAAVSNQSLDGSRFGKRGNATTKDWYSFFGLSITFRLGSPEKCAFKQ